MKPIQYQLAYSSFTTFFTLLSIFCVAGRLISLSPYLSLLASPSRFSFSFLLLV